MWNNFPTGAECTEPLFEEWILQNLQQKTFNCFFPKKLDVQKKEGLLGIWHNEVAGRSLSEECERLTLSALRKGRKDVNRTICN